MAGTSHCGPSGGTRVARMNPSVSGRAQSHGRRGWGSWLLLILLSSPEPGPGASLGQPGLRPPTEPASYICPRNFTRVSSVPGAPSQPLRAEQVQAQSWAPPTRPSAHMAGLPPGQAQKQGLDPTPAPLCSPPAVFPPHTHSQLSKPGLWGAWGVRCRVHSHPRPVWRPSGTPSWEGPQGGDNTQHR